MMDDNRIFWAMPCELISNAKVVHRESIISAGLPAIKKLTLLILVLPFGTVSMAAGEVSTRVCLSDGETLTLLVDPNIPYVYQDIMVGTMLTIIISSDAGGYWDGGLFIQGEDRKYGVLSARDYNDVTLDWEGSRLDAVSSEARVFDCDDVDRKGFDLYSHRDAIAGDWFIIDYTATDVGECSVGFYDYSEPIGMDFPIYEMVFFHVPSRDFNNDTTVNVADLAVIALCWQVDDCNDPDTCAGTDLDANGSVDINDLILFCDYWLEKTR
jgi:hypothetical protein